MGSHGLSRRKSPRAALLAALTAVLAMAHIGATPAPASAACEARPSLSWWYESSATEVTMVFGVSNIGTSTVVPDINIFEPSVFVAPTVFEPGHTTAAFAVTLDPSVYPNAIWLLDCEFLDLDTTELPSQNKLPTSVGPQGIQGIQGIQGDQGLQGLQGEQGIQGPQGEQGVAGSQGLQGATGARGADGAAGLAGALGARGAVGAQGEPGATGAQGPAGPAGAEGAQGATGEQGAPGEPGIVGAQGPVGASGAPGVPMWALALVALLAGVVGGILGATASRRRSAA